MSDDLTISTGDLATSDVMLNIGPQHPATHGVLRLALSLDGDRIVRAEPRIGYMHRGAEKLFEARDYRQIMVLANRHDWLSAFSNELGVALAVERMLGIEVPTRAVWARTLLAELNRVLSHLMFLANLPVGDGQVVTAGYAAREAIQAVMEEASGGRMHFMFNRLGGLKEELPDGWLTRVGAALAEVRRSITEDFKPWFDNDDFRSRCAGLGVLDLDAAKGYGVSGPIARASGLDLDLRRDDPYLAYAELPTELLPTDIRNAGDCLARFECLLDSTESALSIAARCAEVLDELEPGPINVRLPKVVKAPEGETYVWTENPLGITGYYLVSRGERTPWRLKLRTPSFNNIQALPVALAGTHVSELVTVLSSFFFVVGDLDK